MKPPDRFPLAEHAEHRLDRRRFLGAAAGAALVVAAGEWLGHAYASAAAARPDVALPDGGLLARGESRALAASHGREVLMVRLADDALVAFDRRCPHLGCPVLWSAERVRFECPCHHAAFDARTGRVLFGPPRRGLTPANPEGAAPSAPPAARGAALPTNDSSIPPAPGADGAAPSRRNT